MDTIKTKSQTVAADVSALLRSRAPLLWVVTREEARVEGYLVEAAAAAGYKAQTWDVAQGFALPGKAGNPNSQTRDPGEAMTAIARAAGSDLDNRGSDRTVWIMRDLAPWLGGPSNAATCRQLRNLARSLPGGPRESAQAVIVLTPTAEVPPELAGHATLIDWPLPDRTEVAELLDAAVRNLPETDIKTGAPIRAAAIKDATTREAAIDAAIGLSGLEAQGCFAKSLVTTRTIDPRTIAQEKKRVVSAIDGVEWFDPLPGGLDAVGGLDVLKRHLVSRAIAWTPEAKAYGLPAPRGDLLYGVQGCGKSLSAKAIATAWQVPLLKLDLGALKGKFVGESERNLRRVFEVVAAIGRCVLWLDEVEKALAGATDGAADGGVAKDQLGAILNWMQERAEGAYIIATSNDVSGLPPEFLRRFDSTWFVDLPNNEERAEIIRAACTVHGRSLDMEGCYAVAAATAGFIGSEVAGLVPDALYRAFEDGKREPTAADMVAVAATRTPLSKTMAEKISALRAWGRERAKLATTPTSAAQGQGGVQLDI